MSGDFANFVEHFVWNGVSIYLYELLQKQGVSENEFGRRPIRCDLQQNADSVQDSEHELGGFLVDADLGDVGFIQGVERLDSFLCGGKNGSHKVILY